MSITSGALSKSFVVVSDTPPASPFEGQLWRDTSTDVLKQWDGSTWVSVQTSPDGLTTSINSEGNLQALPVIFTSSKIPSLSATSPQYDNPVSDSITGVDFSQISEITLTFSLTSDGDAGIHSAEFYLNGNLKTTFSSRGTYDVVIDTTNLGSDNTLKVTVNSAAGSDNLTLEISDFKGSLGETKVNLD